MNCFSMDSLFDFIVYEIQVCLVLIPYLELHKGFIFSREEKKGKDCPSKEPYTMSNSKGSFYELSLDFEFFIRKTLDELLI